MFKKVIYNLHYNSDDVWFIKISLHNIYIYIYNMYTILLNVFYKIILN